MIDKEKVILMTKAAMDESRHRKQKVPAVSYFADDYVSFQVIKGALGMTVIFALAVACWALYTLDDWMIYSPEQLLGLAIRLGILYLCVLLLSVVVLVLVYTLRYYRARRMVDAEQRNLKKLSRHYENEERKRGE